MIEKQLRKKTKLMSVSALVSIFTLAAYHLPFFSHAVSTLNPGARTAFLLFCVSLILLAANHMACYIVLWTLRFFGKCLIAFTLLANSLAVYFMNTFDVMLDDSMMGNIFNTRFSEASGFFSPAAAAYVAVLGILPCIYLFVRKIDYGSAKRLVANVGASLGVVLLLALVNVGSIGWVHSNSGLLGSYLLPWSYTVNTFRYHNQQKALEREALLLPDATFTDNGKAVFVLMIGESARRDHFSLYGYERKTNPLLENDDIVAIPAISAATYTTAGVKAILDSKPCEELLECLPDYLFRAGADVVWRTGNFGEPKLHIDTYQTAEELQKLFPDADGRYDGILLEGLAETALKSDKNKVFIVLHTGTSHGPLYSKMYPERFGVFQPVCTTAELGKADHQELVNSYDNTILYTDYLIHSAIVELESLPADWRRALIYVSDHGESLGEGGLYMHGVTRSFAPKEQYEIPFVVWSPSVPVKPLDEAGQYNVFHSAMKFLGAESGIYDETMNIFE